MCSSCLWSVYSLLFARPFLSAVKLCSVKYYNDVCFHRVQKGFVIECGDASLPVGAGPASVSAGTAAASVAAATNAAAAASASGSDPPAPLGAPPSSRLPATRGGDSIWGLLYGPQARCFPYLPTKALSHAKRGCVSMTPTPGSKSLHASTFLITLSEGLGYLDETCTPIGQVVEGLEAFIAGLDSILLNGDGTPQQNIRIRHTIVLDDPTPAIPGMDALVPPASPIPILHPFDFEVMREEDAREAVRAATLSAEALEAERLAKEAHSKAVVLEMLGDLPDADAEPPPNVLFVCKLNSCTRSSDLELIFSRFGGLKSCEIITDPKTGASLQYAFLEFETAQACEQAYFKMNNTLIDERRIKVDFSQSVSKQWNQFRRNKINKLKAAAGGGQQKTMTPAATAKPAAGAIQAPVPPAASMAPSPAAPASAPASAAASSSSSSTAAAAAAAESSRPHHHDSHRSRSPGTGRHSSSSSSHHRDRDHRSRDRDDSRDRASGSSSHHHHSSSSSSRSSSHHDRHEEDRHRSRRDDERSGGHSSSSSRRDRSRSRSRDRDRKHRERSRSPRRSEHSSSDRSRDRR